MHFHFTAGDIFFTLKFAGYLVLLVVLLGRDRIRRFPWFTTSIVLLALLTLAIRLLATRLPQATFYSIIIPLNDLISFVKLLVVVEIARRAFGGVRRPTWIVGALVLMGLGAVVLRFWGPWPSWSTLTARSTVSTLRLLQLIAEKSNLLANVEMVAVALLVVLLGSRFKAGWRSHTQQIAIGLSTAAIAEVLLQGLWEGILSSAQKTPAIVQSMPDRMRVMGLWEKLTNTNSTVYIAILIWWIVCLWRDEPGQASSSVQSSAEAAKQAAVGPGAEAPQAE
jgi:hypothetical protein